MRLSGASYPLWQLRRMMRVTGGELNPFSDMILRRGPLREDQDSPPETRGEMRVRMIMEVAQWLCQHNLLREAASPVPRFAAVVCEDIERSGRDMFNALKLEKELSRQGIPPGHAAVLPLEVPRPLPRQPPHDRHHLRQPRSPVHLLPVPLLVR
jgi:hypothetical protein